MRRSFSSLMGIGPGSATGQLKLRVVLVVLLLLNAAAFYFYFDPPGGSQQDLAAEDQQIRNQIAGLNVHGARLQLMASRVETGSSQIVDFQKMYFLPKRVAYGSVIEEIQRMAKLSGLQERDAGFSEEPIEGTSDLSLLNIKGNYQGPYVSLVRFLYESDKSPMLLMLDSVTAAPERSGQIVADIRFQAVIQDRPLTDEWKSDQTKLDSPKPDPTKIDAAKIDATKTDSATIDSAKTDAPLGTRKKAVQTKAEQAPGSYARAEDIKTDPMQPKRPKALVPQP